MSEDCIQKKVEYLESNPSKGFVLCTTACVDEKSFEVVGHFKRNNTNNGNIFKDLIFCNDIYFAPGGYMVRMDSFLTVNPSREIYEGKAGQNWQMLLPIAYKYECGFIDDVLYYYLLRTNSHSKPKQTFKEGLQRIEDLEDTLLNSIKMSNISEEEFKEIVSSIEIKYLKERFYCTLHFNQKQEYKNYYKMLKVKNGLNWSIKKAFYKQENKLIYFILAMFSLPKKILRKLLKRK